jgi:hypothetical protein
MCAIFDPWGLFWVIIGWILASALIVLVSYLVFSMILEVIKQGRNQIKRLPPKE